MMNEHVYDMPIRLRRHAFERTRACYLVDGDTKLLVSRHPTLESACAEARRITAYRAARKLPATALVIIPTTEGGVQ